MFRRLAIFLGLALAGPPTTPAVDPPPAGARTIHFCFWNVENLFDDQDDARNSTDEEFDNPFAKRIGLRQEKYDHIAEALLRMNGGKGPDVIACAEVESVRAADLLKGTLNRKLDEMKADPALRYSQVAMKNLDAGRHIAPCLITRVPVLHGRTKLHGNKLRILETHLQVNGHELTVIASHWTSKIRQSDGGDGEAGRSKYAAQIYDVFAEQARRNAKVDLLVCGDFNDTPGSKPLAFDLGTTGDRKRVTPKAEGAQLLDLMAESDPKTGQDKSKDPGRFGTHWYNGRPLIYDHICISPGLLDAEGWRCDPDSLRVPTEGLVARGSTRRQPWRFGDPDSPPTQGRGYSDHFPVIVTLTVAPPKKPSR